MAHTNSHGLFGCLSNSVATRVKISQLVDKMCPLADKGPVVQKWISANPGLKFNLLF